MQSADWPGSPLLGLLASRSATTLCRREMNLFMPIQVAPFRAGRGAKERQGAAPLGGLPPSPLSHGSREWFFGPRRGAALWINDPRFRNFAPFIATHSGGIRVGRRAWGGAARCRAAKYLRLEAIAAAQPAARGVARGVRSAVPPRPAPPLPFRLGLQGRLSDDGTAPVWPATAGCDLFAVPVPRRGGKSCFAKRAPGG